MDAILEIAGRHGIPVVEDNAHGLLGKFKGRYLGTMGCLATQSFHETKNVTCGEGGALIVNDEGLIERAEIIREKGTNRNRFLRGQVDKYSWVDIGSSFLPSDLLAAFLLGQLEVIDRIQEKRRRIWTYYHGHIQDWARRNGVSTPFIPAHCEHPHHMYYLLMPSLNERQALIEKLRSKNIFSVFHYLPLHLSVMGRRFGGRDGECPVTEDVSDRLVRLPFYNSLSQQDQDRVLDALG
jgi:dTDP-4-amino-4,6-dideoxygalactose transaminase